MNNVTILGISPFNDLQIPAAMSAIEAITMSVALALLVLFAAAESIRMKAQSLRAIAPGSQIAKPNYADFIIRYFFVFIGLLGLYNWIFLKMVSLCDHISMLLSNEDQWMGMLATLNQSGDTTISWVKLTVPTLMGATSLTALQYVEEVFTAIRFVLLCLLYCIGPIAWAFGLSEIGTGVTKGWFKNTWEISFWLVVFSIVKAALIPLVINAFSNGAAAGSAAALIYSIVILIAICMIPSLTSAVFSGANIGAVASAAMTIASYSSIREAAARGDALHEVLKGSARWKSFADTPIQGAVASAAGKTWSGIKAAGKGISDYVRGDAEPSTSHEADRTR